jgi:DNA-binding transcriptional ArsR family regulator
MALDRDELTPVRCRGRPRACRASVVSTLRTDLQTGNELLESACYTARMGAEWSFLTNHARVLVCIAHDPGLRLRDVAEALGLTERTVFGIVTDLTDAGYLVKEKDGRRNRYRVQHHLPLRQPVGRQATIGELLDLLVASSRRDPRRPGQTAGSGPSGQGLEVS